MKKSLIILVILLSGCASTDVMDEPKIGNYFFPSIRADKLENGNENKKIKEYDFKYIGNFNEGVLYAKTSSLGNFSGALFVRNEKITKIITSEELAKIITAQVNEDIDRQNKRKKIEEEWISIQNDRKRIEEEARLERLRLEKESRDKIEAERKRVIDQARIEYTENKKNIDLTAQVLNYSSGLADFGSFSDYWYKLPQSNCVYVRRKNQPADVAFLQGFLSLGSAAQPMSPSQVDINRLDPKSIRFTHEVISESVNRGQNIINHSLTVIKANDGILFRTNNRLDLLRLSNGWSKVFNNQCKGMARAF
jgi:hypothetical protein